MFARGLKRKCTEQDEAAGGPRAPSYRLQRQSLLDMSLVKLQLCHMLVEPNLCRSVLIANTVRQIQEEMTQDGTWRATPPAAGPMPLEHLVSTDILCRAEEGAPVPALVPPGDAWEGDGLREGRGGLHKSLGQIFETLEAKSPSCMEELFSEVDSPYYDLDAVLTGMVASTPGEGLEGFAPTATTTPGSSCKADLGEQECVLGVLVEA